MRVQREAATWMTGLSSIGGFNAFRSAVWPLLLFLGPSLKLERPGFIQVFFENFQFKVEGQG